MLLQHQAELEKIQAQKEIAAMKPAPRESVQ